MSLIWEGANFGLFSRHHVRAVRKVAELFAFGDDFSSNFSNEAELEFQSERAYRAVEFLILWRAAADDDGQYCFAVAL
jgi:hypothetical protein